jgi:hypothetical protein
MLMQGLRRGDIDMLQCSGVLHTPHTGFPEVRGNQKPVHCACLSQSLLPTLISSESSIAPNPEYVVCCGLQSEAFVDMH